MIKLLDDDCNYTKEGNLVKEKLRIDLKRLLGNYKKDNVCISDLLIIANEIVLEIYDEWEEENES